MPEDATRCWCKRADKLFPATTNLENLVRGGTMMSLMDCIKLQEMLSLPKTITVTKVNSGVGVAGGMGQVETLTFVPNWPWSLISVHPYNCFGAKFPTMPAFTEEGYVGDCRLLWMLCCCIVHVPALWDEV